MVCVICYDLDRDKWPEITQVKGYQRNQWILSYGGLVGSFDVLWLDRSQITDPDLDHPNGIHPR